MGEGTADVKGSLAVEMMTDGPCLAGTIEQLAAGVGARPMPVEALARVKTDALGLLSKVLQEYERGVAPGEIGVSGSARASQVMPPGGRTPTGLLYGRVQSGKTVAMITFCAAAIDNGFRVIVVLTSDFVKLVEQTADRFGALDGPLIKSSLQADGWSDDREHVKKYFPRHGVVFVCSKNQQRLSGLVDFLRDIGAADYPALVLDDEADQATLDTTANARTSGRPNAPARPSVIHRRTVTDEEGQSVRQTLRHHVFVQVTATPYALLLQNVDSELRPSFTHLIEPGVGYTGGEAFFDAQHVEDGRPPLNFVADDESAKFEDGSDTEAPLGLQRALAFFLVAAGAQNVVDPASRGRGQNFLCHTSQKTSEHSQVADLIRRYLHQLSGDLDSDDLASGSPAMIRLQWGYDELKRTLPEAPAFADVLERIKKRLPRRDVPVVNSNNSPVDFGRELNFIVGGNILGRGLTIDNLLVTYYIRRAKVSQMDTVLQHARMFGYRQNLMPLTRVFLPEALAARFHFIHVAERNLRAQLSSASSGKIIVETMASLRATRLNVLDTRNLAAYEPGGHIYPGGASFSRKALDRGTSISASAARISGGTLRHGEYLPVTTSDLVELVKLVPFDEDLANMWDPRMMEQILNRLAPRYGNKGMLFYRTMSRSSQHFSTGALSGPELTTARAQGVPVFCLFRDDGKKQMERTHGREYWYPTLVMPSDMPTQVFNVTEP